MIPTIAASTGAALRPSASPAAFPSITTSTRSPMPAPTESMASSGPPRGAPSGPCGWTSSSFAPSSLRCFWVETTVPTTSASCMARARNGRKSLFLDGDGIDDADNGGVDRAVLHAGGHAGGAAGDDQDGFAETGVDGVDGHQVA